MSAFTAINLSTLPAPEIVETPDFEAIMADMKAHLIAAIPEMAAVMALESEPLVKAFEVFAYRETVMRARVNDAAKGVMLAHAKNGDLDNLAAFFGVQRQVVQTADATVIPPRLLVFESDERLRTRTQMSLEGFACAGPIGAYISHGLSAHPDVKDISVDAPRFSKADIDAAIMAQLPPNSIVLQVEYDAGLPEPKPGDIAITVLSATGDGEASADLIGSVETALNDEDVRPLTDHPLTRGAFIKTYSLDATLTLYDGPDADLVLEAAILAAGKYVTDHHVLGHDITISGLHAALHQAGVQKVDLTAPLDTLVVAPNQAAFCDGINIVIGGRDA